MTDSAKDDSVTTWGALRPKGDSEPGISERAPLFADVSAVSGPTQIRCLYVVASLA